ncbi:MAG: hypothetical protein IPL61_18880 [Myxococcales bacterium]|nr:hypothetical protein [Myxococcales bacterium]
MSTARPGLGAAMAGALADRETRGRWGLTLAIVALLALATWWFQRGHDARGWTTAEPYADAPYYYVYLPSLALDHDLDLTDEYAVTQNWYRFGRTPTGKPGNVFGVGPALLSLPAFGLGHVASIATNDRQDGFGQAEVTAVMWMSVLLSTLALVFPARVIARRFAPGPVGLFAALMVAAAGPVVYYAVRQPGYAHPYATFFAAWLIDAWDASYDRPRTARTWAWLGLLLGLAALARPQLATWGVLLVAAAVDDLRRTRPSARLVGRWALGAAVTAACVLPQLLVWRAMYGALYVVPQGDGFMRWDAPAWSEVLFSSRNGLFHWAPLYALAALGLIAACARRARLAGLLIVGVALQVVINGAAWDWWGGGSFGGRRFDSCYAAFAIGLGALLAPGVLALATITRRPRWARAALALVTAPLAALAIALAIATVGLAIHYDSTTARIYGGDRAANVYRIHLQQGVRRRAGQVAARASIAATWPARALFAARHGVPLDTYDRVVGVHFLGETFPGLNSVPPPREDRRDVAGLPPPFRYGLVPARGRPGVLRLAGPVATLLVPLNRTGGVTVTVRVRHPDGAPVRAYWNQRLVATATVGADETALTWTTFALERGVNELALVSAPELELARLELVAVEPPSR